MQNRRKTYLIAYLVLAGATILFLTLSNTLHLTVFQNLSAICLFAWIPLVAVSVFSCLPQTIAGNLFVQMKHADPEKRRQGMQSYCSASMLDTEMFTELAERDYFAKPIKVSKNRVLSQKSGKKVYDVFLKGYAQKYHVTVVRRNPEEDLHRPSGWVVDSVEQFR